MKRLHFTALCLGFLILAGCGEQPFPAALPYPLRSDLIVDRLPETNPDGPPPAGKFDEFIAKINERGGKTLDPAALPAEQQATLRQSLAEMFGTPAEPIVRADDDDTRTKVERLQLQPETLAAASVLYKKHCLQCHGLTGDGRGPTGQWVYPFPRDFRRGVFKYVSSAGSAARKPTRSDLERLMASGIERTSMPSFSMLSDDERRMLASYTIHLSVRGEVEFRLMRGLLGHDDSVDDDLAAATKDALKLVLRQWVAADSDTITPATLPTPDDPNLRVSESHLESVRRGQKLFASPAVGCISCHADYGRQARYLYDVWGGSTRVADLTEGVYHGGKHPVDLYQRIKGGIGPSNMPAASSLTETETWDLVHFLLALPAPTMLPPDVRDKIYPAQ